MSFQNRKCLLSLIKDAIIKLNHILRFSLSKKHKSENYSRRNKQLATGTMNIKNYQGSLIIIGRDKRGGWHTLIDVGGFDVQPKLLHEVLAHRQPGAGGGEVVTPNVIESLIKLIKLQLSSNARANQVTKGWIRIQRWKLKISKFLYSVDRWTQSANFENLCKSNQTLLPKDNLFPIDYSTSV
jgi:hypothetical protein